MSDYLSSLAARSLKLTGVIRPRLRSIFEPPDFAAISEEDGFIENTPAKRQAAGQSSHSPHQSKFSQHLSNRPLSDQHLSNQHLSDLPQNLNTSTAMDYPAAVKLQPPTEKPETNDQKEAGCKDLSAIGSAGADRIEAMDFLIENSEGSARPPLKTEAIHLSHPNQMASSSQDHQMPASSAEGANRNANEKLGPDGLADSGIGPEKALPQAHGQEIQLKAISLTDEAAVDTVGESITGVEHPNTEKKKKYHSQERPNLPDRNAQMPQDEERRHLAIQSHQDHSTLKAPDQEILKRTEQEASVPPIESMASFEKKLLENPISPMDFFRAAEAVQESNSEYGQPAKLADRLSASGSALSKAEAYAKEIARPRDSLLPSDLPSREISSRDEPDARSLPGKIEPMSPNPHLQDSQSLRTEVDLPRGIQEENTLLLRINPASMGDNARIEEDSKPRPSPKKIDQHSDERANPASRAALISCAQETIPYENPSIQDQIHADPIRPESDEFRPNGFHLIENRQKNGKNSIDEPANVIPLTEKKLQIINQIQQLDKSSKAAISQIEPIERKRIAELLPFQVRKGLLPSGQIETATESTSGEDPWPKGDRAESREPTREGSNELEPEAQMVWPEKTPQIINQIQLAQSSKAAISQIGPIEGKRIAELRPSQAREGLVPSGQIETAAESTSGEDPWPTGNQAESREPTRKDSNEIEPEAQVIWPEKTPQIINQIQLAQSSKAALFKIGPIEGKKITELRPSQAREGLLPSGQIEETARVRAGENFIGPRANLSAGNNPLHQPSSRTNDDKIQLKDLDDKIGLSLIKDLHSSSNRISSSESDGDDLFFPSSRRYAMTRTAPDILSSDQVMRSRVDHSPNRHAYESVESVANSNKRHSPPLPAAIKSRKAFSERKVEESRDEKTAPSVRVTIGRIEVRAAIAPEKPAEKARSKIQILSLDDYLRLRNGGQR